MFWDDERPGCPSSPPKPHSILGFVTIPQKVSPGSLRTVSLFWERKKHLQISWGGGVQADSWCHLLGGGFKYVIFSPLPGEMILFQMGWNHQPVVYFFEAHSGFTWRLAVEALGENHRRTASRTLGTPRQWKGHLAKGMAPVGVSKQESFFWKINGGSLTGMSCWYLATGYNYSL